MIQKDKTRKFVIKGYDGKYLILSDCRLYSKSFSKHKYKFGFSKYNKWIFNVRQIFFTFGYNAKIFMTVAALNTDDLKNISNSTSFDTNGTTAVVDNSANAHVWKHESDFVEGSLSSVSATTGVATIGDKTLVPKGKGDLKIILKDDVGQSHELILKDALYFPTSPVNIISCTALAEQLNDENGTTIKTFWKHSIFEWDHGKNQRTIIHSESKLPVIEINEGFSVFTTFSEVFDKQMNQNVNIKQINSTFKIGDQVCYSKDGHTEIGTLDRIEMSENDLVPYFRISFGGTREIKTTKEFVFHVDEPDLATIPVSPAQLQKFAKFLTIEALEQLMSPIPIDSLLHEFMIYHHKLNHLPYQQMFILADKGVLPKKFRKIKSYLKKPLCPSCLFGQVKRRPWRHKIGNKAAKHIRKHNEIKVGDKVSIDQMSSAHPGLVPTITGRHTRERITGLTCYIDNFSRRSYSHLQTSLDTDQTLDSKIAFERDARSHGVKIKSYHADNGRFAEKCFRDEVEKCNQKISFCGVGAHHQNGIIERHIGLLTTSTRTLLLHAKRHWPEAISTILWPFAWKAAERRHNILHVNEGGSSPENIFCGNKTDIDLSIFHPWGCPIFVLDYRGTSTIGKIPKWEPRCRVGIYLGHSPCHAGNVALVLNPRTLHISPQYHVVFDDDFSTVPFMKNGTIPPNWEKLVFASSEIATDEDFDLAMNWSRDEYDEDKSDIEDKVSNSTEEEISSPEDVVNPLLMPTVPDLDALTLRRSKRTRKPTSKVKELKEKGVKGFSNFFSKYCVFSSSFMNSKIYQSNPQTYLQKMIYHSQMLNSNFDGSLNGIDSMVLMADSSSNDVFTFKQMMEQEDRIDFLQAMLKEVDDHETRQHWSVVERNKLPPGTKTIMAIWSFKRKRFPDGRIMKHKARLCAHGGMQRWGENYWETYSPVVNWLSVRLLLSISIIHKLHTRSIDFVLAFPQAKLEENIYMEMPIGMDYGDSSDKRKYVLKLEKNLYGLKQASYNFWQLLSKGLVDRGFVPSKIDPCVFLRPDAIIVCYVDDCIAFCKSPEIGDEIVKSLKEGKENFVLTDEGSLERYLGMDILKKDNHVEIVQKHLIERILTLLEIGEGENTRPTPVTKPLLYKDLEGLGRKCKWNYRQAIGMLNYLQNSTRPDISMATHQCARFCNQPMQSHERAVKRIGRYLKGNKNRGINFQPDVTKGIECFVDADFAGGWNKLDSENPENCYSRTGFFIKYCGCPILWRSALQTEISLSTAESEYIALSSALREVIPMIRLSEEIEEIFKIETRKVKLHCKVFEDNESCIKIATQNKFTPRTKHIALKYHHFKKYISENPDKISIHSIHTKEQIADALTKPLDENCFSYLRYKLNGW